MFVLSHPVAAMTVSSSQPIILPPIKTISPVSPPVEREEGYGITGKQRGSPRIQQGQSQNENYRQSLSSHHSCSPIQQTGQGMLDQNYRQQHQQQLSSIGSLNENHLNGNIIISGSASISTPASNTNANNYNHTTNIINLHSPPNSNGYELPDNLTSTTPMQSPSATNNNTNTSEQSSTENGATATAGNGSDSAAPAAAGGQNLSHNYHNPHCQASTSSRLSSSSPNLNPGATAGATQSHNSSTLGTAGPGPVNLPGLPILTSSMSSDALSALSAAAVQAASNSPMSIARLTDRTAGQQQQQQANHQHHQQQAGQSMVSQLSQPQQHMQAHTSAGAPGSSPYGPPPGAGVAEPQQTHQLSKQVADHIAKLAAVAPRPAGVNMGDPNDQLVGVGAGPAVLNGAVVAGAQAADHAYNSHLNLRARKMCDVCGRSFSNLSMHKSTHYSSLRQHTCNTCGRSFARINDLCRHERSHRSDAAFICPLYVKPQAAAINASSHGQMGGAQQDASSTLFQPSCHQNGGFSRCDTYKNHLKAMHFDYPAGTKKRDRNGTPGACKGCGKDFPDADTWIATHIESEECEGIRRVKALNEMTETSNGGVNRVKQEDQQQEQPQQQPPQSGQQEQSHQQLQHQSTQPGQPGQGPVRQGTQPMYDYSDKNNYYAARSYYEVQM